MVRQVIDSGSSQSFIDSFISAINDAITANKLCNETSWELCSREDCWAAHGGPLVVLAGLKKHAKFLLNRASRAVIRLTHLGVLSDCQSSVLLSLVEVSSSLESLLVTSSEPVTPATVAVLSSTLCELASIPVPSFKFLRAPRRFRLPKDLPNLVDSEDELEVPVQNGAGPVAESSEVSSNQEPREMPSTCEKPRGFLNIVMGMWQQRNARRRRSAVTNPTQHPTINSKNTETKEPITT